MTLMRLECERLCERDSVRSNVETQRSEVGKEVLEARARVARDEKITKSLELAEIELGLVGSGLSKHQRTATNSLAHNT